MNFPFNSLIFLHFKIFIPMDGCISSQIHLHFTVLEIIAGELEYDFTEYIYKGKTAAFNNSFSVVIQTLNDIIFGTIYVTLVQKTSGFFGFNKTIKIAGAAIRLLGLINSRTDEHTYDMIPVIDLMSADYYDKNPPLLGRFRVRFEIRKLDVPMVESRQNGFVRRMINKLFSVEMSNSFEAINDLTYFLTNGSTTCNLKTIAGMLIIDGFLIKKLACSNLNHSGMNGCFKGNCLKSYGDIPLEDAKLALRMVDGCFAAFLDSKIMSILFKPSINLPNIKNKKLRSILERLNISQDKVLKYFEGSHKLVGFVIFVEQDTLVVALRGTVSSNDLVNDMDASYAEFLKGYSHSGILKLSKMFIQSELEDIKNILERCSFKRLLITGYSLGGGVATILHMMIIESKLIPNCEVKTIVFASPPTVSESLLKKKVPGLRTYNYGNDIVPRLSIGSLMDFKFLCLSIANVFNVFADSQKTLDKITEIHQHLLESNTYPKLYHPGEVWHIKMSTVDDKDVYGFKRITSKFFGSLVIYKDFLPDHLLNKYIAAFSFIKNMKEKTTEGKA